MTPVAPAGNYRTDLKTFVLRTKTNADGRFSVPHGHKMSEGSLVVGIHVAVQHKNGNWHTLEYSHKYDNRFWWNTEVVAGIINTPNFAERPVQIVTFVLSFPP